MAMSRKEAQMKIDSQRATVREHIEKYNRYIHDHEKEFALKTISKAQVRIQKCKDSCNQYISDSWEDDWED